MKIKQIFKLILYLFIFLNEIYSQKTLKQKQNLFLENSKIFSKNKILNELKYNKNLEFNKYLYILPSNILVDIQVTYNKFQISKIITKKLNFNLTKYSDNIITFIYPNKEEYFNKKINLIKNIKNIETFETIKDKIIFTPDKINLEKQICIPIITNLKMENNFDKNIFLLDVKTDLYQIKIEKTINQKIIYPKNLYSGESHIFQIMILPDLLETIKGNIYIEYLLDNQLYNIIYPIQIKGIENNYKIKPLYFRIRNKGKFSSEISIYNPHSEPLIINDMINNFNSISISFNNGINKDIEISPKSNKKILNLNIFDDYSGSEYGLINLITNKDIISIPVLIQIDNIPFNIFPSFFDFGIIKNFNKEIRVIPISISNKYEKQKLIIKGIFFKNNENYIGFIKKEDYIILNFNQTKTVGFLFLNSSEIKYNENKKFKGTFYLETNNKIKPIVKLKYRFYYETNEDKNFIMNNNLNIENLDNNYYIHRINFPNQIPFDLTGNNKSYESLNITNFFKVNFWSPNKNSLKIEMKVEKNFSALNVKNYYIPLRNCLNSFYILPFTIYDKSFDFSICKLNNGSLEMCEELNLFKTLFNINDPLTSDIFDIGDIPLKKKITRYLIFKNQNNINISFKIKTTSKKLFLEKDSKIIKKISLPPFSEFYFNLIINTKLIKKGNYSEKISFIFENSKVKHFEIKMNIVKGKIYFIPSNLYFYYDIINYHNTLKVPITIEHTYPLNIKVLKVLTKFPYIITYENYTNYNFSSQNNSNLIAKLNINPYRILYSKIIDRNKYMISYFQLFQWKQLKQFFKEISIINKNVTVYTSLGPKNLTFSIKNGLIPDFKYTQEVNFNIVQIGDTFKKFINIYNPTDKILTVKPFIADLKFFGSKFNFSDINIPNFNDLYNEYYNFSCYFIDKNSFSFNPEILFSPKDININNIEDNFINKINSKLKDKNKGKRKNILCRYKTISKNEIFLKNILSKSKSALLSYNIDIELKNNYKEVYLDKKASNLITINPGKIVKVGPIIYSPITNLDINSVLVLRNNQTFISFVKLNGKGGEGVPLFYIDNILGINNTIILNVNEPLTFLNKDVKIKNVGNFDLQIRNIKFNYIDYTNSINDIIQINQSEILQIKIPVLYNFNDFIYTLFLEYGICQNISLNIILKIDENLLYSKNSFFEFGILKILFLCLIFSCTFLIIKLTLKKDNLFNVKYLKEDDFSEFKIENEFIKSYIKRNDEFYEEFAKKINELILNFPKEEKQKKKRKRNKTEKIFLEKEKKIIENKISEITKEESKEEIKIEIPEKEIEKNKKENNKKEEKKEELSLRTKELIEQYNAFSDLKNAFIPQFENEIKINLEETKIEEKKTNEKKEEEEQILEYDFKSLNSNEIFNKFQNENIQIERMNSQNYDSNSNNNFNIDFESSGTEDMNFNIKNILRDSLLNYNFGNINIIDENREEEEECEDEQKLIEPYFDFNPFSNNNNYIEEDIKIKKKIEENIKDKINKGILIKIENIN